MLFSDLHRDGVFTRVTTNRQLTPNTDSYGGIHECERCENLVAQLEEHLPYKQRVAGSSPAQPISCEIVVMVSSSVS